LCLFLFLLTWQFFWSFPFLADLAHDVACEKTCITVFNTKKKYEILCISMLSVSRYGLNGQDSNRDLPIFSSHIF
jgi:hypothetical protein